MLRNSLLCSTVAAVAIALAGTANATTLPVVWGGGSTLAQYYYQSVFATLNTSTAKTATFGANSTNDPTNSQVGYAGIGSGSGRSQFELNVPNTTHSGNLEVAGDDIAYGASDAFIGASDLTAYNTTNTTSGASVAGPLVQLPLLGTPVTIAYDITPNLVAGKSNPIPASIVITDADLAKIYSDTAPTWLDVASIKAIVAKYPSAFQSPAFGPLSVVIRSDSSGTTFLFTQHLQSIVAKTASASAYSTTGFTGPVSTWSASLFTGTEPSFVQGSGSGQVANYLAHGSITATTGAAPANAIGYISPDYTVEAPKSFPNTTYGYNLKVATLVNATDGKSYLPTPANTTLGLSSPGTKAAHLGAPTTQATAAVQTNWVPSIQTPTAGYPIVGYTNMLFAQCYSKANAGVATELLTFLKNHFNGTYATQIATAGFVAVPASFASEIQATFVTNSNAYSPALNINTPSLCKGASGATSAAKYVGR